MRVLTRQIRRERIGVSKSLWKRRKRKWRKRGGNVSLRVWAPLNGDLRQIGASNVILTNNGAVIDNNGKIGKCYSFNGNNYYIALTGQELFDCFKGGTTAFSICMWVYHADTRRAILFGDYGLSNSIGFNIELNTGHGLRFYWNGSPDYSPGINVGLNTWSHITLTYDGASLKSYLNGNLIATRDGALATRSKTAGEFRLGRDTRTTDTALNGKLNDVRIYDHCLSVAEIHEVAQGLVLHYKLSETDIENTINYAPTPYKDSYSSISPGWDASKHPNAIQPQNWASGYNSGVSAPATGYHAMWNIIDGIPTIVFQNHNSEVGKTGRWLGVSSSSLSFSIPANTKYTISYEQRTIDTLGGYTTSGVYYKYNSSIGTNFHDGCPKIGQNTVLNTWERFSYTFTRNSNVDGTGTNGTIYIYGNNGTESTMQVRNIQLEIKDHATAYTQSSRTNIIVQDSSGYGHYAISNGSATVVLDSDTAAKYSYSTKFVSGSRIAMPVASSTCLPTDAITVSIWYKSSNGTARFLSCTEGGGWNFEVNSSKASFPFYIKGKGYGRVIATKNFYSDNQWHMLTASYDGISTAKIYLDGILDNTSTIASGWENLPIAYPSSTPLTLGAEAQTIASPIAGAYVGNLSDLRIYCTALSDADILALYHTSAKIDNKQNLHTFELVEPATRISINKQGQILCNELEETSATKFFKTNQIIETNNLIEL